MDIARVFWGAKVASMKGLGVELGRNPAGLCRWRDLPRYGEILKAEAVFQLTMAAKKREGWVVKQAAMGKPGAFDRLRDMLGLLNTGKRVRLRYQEKLRRAA